MTEGGMRGRGLAWFLGIGVVALGVMGLVLYATQPARDQAPSGIARRGKDLFVVSCDPAGIGTAEPSEARDPGPEVGRTVWKARARGPAARSVRIGTDVAGYSVVAIRLPRRGDYALSGLTNGDGTSVIPSVIRFRPDRLADGEVVTAHGVERLQAFRSSAPDCGGLRLG